MHGVIVLQCPLGLATQQLPDDELPTEVAPRDGGQHVDSTTDGDEYHEVREQIHEHLTYATERTAEKIASLVNIRVAVM